ncbi:protein obstructor-E [Trichonephila clavipes]|nr:protein obstructor-E [Trichonephila clavipes]
MENLRLLLVLTVLCAVLGDVLAQNRGSVRYSGNDEEFDGDSTRAQPPAPTRRVSSRRRRPTPAPEPAELADELPAYQAPKRVGTTGRRVPSRVSTQEFAPPPPAAPLLPEEPILPVVVDELAPITTATPDDKTQGRRRRPKKRRRPQNGATKPGANPEKQNINDPEKIKVPVTELIDTDQKRPQPYSSNPELNSNPNTYDSPAGLADKALWPNNKLENSAGEPGLRNPEPTQYYPPQVGTNRLPIDDSEGNEPRGFGEPEAPVLNQEIPSRRYIPPNPVEEQPSRGSYVPVLAPIRVPSDTHSRLPLEDYTESRTQENNQRGRQSQRISPQRSAGTRTPSVPIPDEASRISGASPAQNFIPRDNQPSIPERSHAEVRLPATEQPFLVNEYDKAFDSQPGYEDVEEILSGLNNDENTSVGNIDQPMPTTSTRLPSSEVHYDTSYPDYNENIGPADRSRTSEPNRREETEPQAPRSSYNEAPPQETPKRTQSNNNPDTGRSQLLRYEPPLQRYGSRGGSEGSDLQENPRHSTRDSQPSAAPTRGRGSSRYQSERAPEEITRTRGSSRSSSDSSSGAPTRTRSSQAPSQAPTRSRNTQRYQPDPEESSSRVSTRRQPVDTEYAAVEDRPTNYRQRVPAPVADEEPEYVRQPPRGAPVRELPEDIDPVGNTQRSRPPQYDDRDEPYLYEEPLEDQREPIAYEPEYQAPRQTNRRQPPVQRTPPPREQPERQITRQPSRRQNAPQREAPRHEQPDYREPQENTRYQPQYQAPQNTRHQSRPAPQSEPNQGRQQAPRQQSRARQPEPSPNQGRSSGSSRFSCPEGFGYFADPVQCDKYYECRNGTAVESLCEDGLAFNEIGAPKFLRCDSLRDVDCSARPELQEAKPTKNCPRRYGLYPHETDCTKFWNCVDGAATEVQCPPGLTFNDDRATCDWADLVKSSCKTEDLLGFTCPEPNAVDLQDGVYTTYPHPDNCQLHFVCIKGEDGARRPRMLTCHEGLVYDPVSKTCSRPDGVAGCEDFYGIRSPPPKQRKPAAREPIEEEEYEDPPTPKPRRRVQNRRVRN